MWLRNVVVDLTITAVIVLWALGVLPDWARWIVYVYTPLIALLKIMAMATGLDKVKQKATPDEPPALFYHLLFGINVATLLYAYFAQQDIVVGIMAGLWLVTWVLSAFSERRKYA